MKQSKEELDAIEQETFKNAKRNPLANYPAQIKYNPGSVRKKIRDTSLDGDHRLHFANVGEDEDIYFRNEYGNFDFCKLISSASIRNMVLSMKANTQKLFLWIIYSLGRKNEVIELNYYKKQVVEFGMSYNTFKDSIQELEKNEIIKRIGKTQKQEDYWMFFVNPQIMFVGDAKKYYKGVTDHHPEYLKPL